MTQDNLLVVLLTVLFIGLKLTGYIDWSWWWVLAPVWMPLVLSLVVIYIVVLFEFIVTRK